jgi:hypothetical protein
MPKGYVIRTPKALPGTEAIVDRKHPGAGHWRTATTDHLTPDTRVMPTLNATAPAWDTQDHMHSRKTEGDYSGSDVGAMRQRKDQVVMAVIAGIIAPEDAPTWALRKAGMLG